MKLRVVFLTCLAFSTAFIFASLAIPAFAQDEGKDDGDDKDEEEEDEWGEARIDHALNAGWEYPSDYVQRPLVFPKHVSELGMSFDYKNARHYYDEDGTLVEGSFKSKKQVLNLNAGIGFTDRWSVRVNFPLVWKKTKITSQENQNYRVGRENTYGFLAEEATVDYLDNHELWKLWEADLPTLGDVEVWMGYSPFRPKTLEKDQKTSTSWIFETVYKAPTGNDNPRRGAHVRSYLTDGNPNFYLGTAVKQYLYFMSAAVHAGYNWRMPASVKYLAGEVDYADEIKVDGELAFQLPKKGAGEPFNPFALVIGGHYMTRVTDSEIKDNNGNTEVVEDTPGFMASVEPKLVYHGYTGFFEWFSGDLYFSADIPVAGQRSFFVESRSLALPPFDVESYEGVGITYTLGLIKRWE